jgi:hypothetical protein
MPGERTPNVVPPVSRNPVTLAGVFVTTVSALAFITFYVVQELGYLNSPYAGLFGFLLVPALFALGLLLIPFGMWREGRRRLRGGIPWRWPLIDLGSGTTRRVLAAVATLTLVNLAIVAIAGFGATHHMESTGFCGQTCHEPMKPQFIAHQVGAHASVGCVACHVGPGAAGTIKAKLNGTRQLYEVAFHNFPRPIRADGRVPPAAGTCLSCHQPGFTPRDTTRVIREYADDEANTETVTTLDMFTARAHWHARPDVKVEYMSSATDPSVVTYVKASVGGAAPTEYLTPGVPSMPPGPLRQMDCTDCHSRPAHTFSATAERAVDRAIGAGEISRTLPFVRKEIVAALKGDYATEPAALQAISQRLTQFYASRDSTLAPEVSRAVAAAQRLYRNNVFPEMKVTWGTYVPQLGHVDAPGCFRCHDDERKSVTGKMVSQDCELCHKTR